MNDRLAALIDVHLGRRSEVKTSRTPFQSDLTLDEIIWAIETSLPDSSDGRTIKTVYSGLARVFEHWRLLDRREKALASLEAASRDDDYRIAAKVHALRGANELAQGHITKAFLRFERSLDVMESPFARAQLGMMALKQRKLDAGIASLEQAAHSWDPSTPATGSWPVIWRNLSGAYLRVDRLESALAACEMARFLKLHVPLYVESLLEIAKQCRSRSAFELEEKIYSRALQQLSAWDRFDESETRLVEQIARLASSLHPHQERTSEAALRSYLKPLRNSEHLKARFETAFRMEVDDLR